ncbi:hypothetical protein Oter_4414 [Opitutus terrae PB90-1]|uniref:Uncharacterized protein n=1 Tax=Opitutus terrae (strain DSM 11246 / JCM 15787 / PB90-1) TaxID=452637 RepID=B1ZRN7_OPITP|nr:hypothetical protein Oter_4414 [Opitutus terrae PB90-1]
MCAADPRGTTENSHVDLVFLDVANRVLRVEIADFSPRWLPRGSRPPQTHGYLRRQMPEIPSGTATIEVRGHDGLHEAQPGFLVP